MRTYVAVTALCLAIGSMGRQASAQGGGRDTVRRILDRHTRIGLINDVLLSRARMFGQPMSIDSCGLTNTVGPGPDLRDSLPRAFRESVVELPACRLGRRSPVDGTETALIFFETIEFEGSEYIANPDRSEPRPPDLVVVRMRVNLAGSRQHTEEWVLTPAGWVMTVRMFWFSVS